MILAVAIYQWGGAGGPGEDASAVAAGGNLTVTHRDLDELIRADAAAAHTPPSPAATDPGTWPGGIPKTYRIERDDKVWVLVFKRWGLKESFVQAIEQANPKIDFKRLKPGTSLVIPDPSTYKRAVEKSSSPQKPKGARIYEVKGGDTLESIAYLHLGAKTRWPDIVAANPGLDPKRLSEGQEIYLPAK
jgi:nucleoid-associated protein YgaU